MAITPISDNAFVMTAICPSSKNLYGITVDRVLKNAYKMVWAFKIDPNKAKREGYDSTKVKGSLDPDSEYPGCPYCKAKQLVFCGCGATMCWNGEKVIKCAKCGSKGEVNITETIDMRGGWM